jgi:cytoskeleton protein RodZ
MDIGTELRQAREARGITLAQLVVSTKISPQNLRAIERNAFDRLPGGLFTRGFLRAYAREVGLDPEEIVRQYISEHETPEPAVPGQLPGERRQTVDRRVSIADRPGSDLTASDIDNLDRRLQRSQLMGTAAIAVVGAVVYFMLAGETPRQDADAAAPGVRAPAAPASPAIGTAGGARTTSPSTTVGQRDGVHVEVQPKGPCWVGATSDGKPAVRRLMNVGERVMIDAREEAIVRIGDAGACALSVNGSPAVPVGTAGKPATLRITKDSSSDFAARGLRPPRP